MEKENKELHLMIDADSIVVKAAMAAQTNYCLYKDGKKIKPVKSRGAWIKENPKSDPDIYEFRREATLISNGRTPSIDICKYSISKTIAEISDKYPDRKPWVCLEAGGNYRDELYPDYKGQREGEILLRKQLVEWVKKHFPRVVLAFNCETDDRVARYMYAGYKDYLATGVYTYMGASCDKDLRTVPGLLYNYCKDEETEISELEADRWFCAQLLMGDAVDNIKGVNGPLEKEYVKSHGLRYSSKGVGEATAVGLLKSCESSKECFEKVMECYKQVHEDKWLDKLKVEGIGLRMQRKEDERYDITTDLDRYGVAYEK